MTGSAATTSAEGSSCRGRSAATVTSALAPTPAARWRDQGPPSPPITTNLFDERSSRSTGVRRRVTLGSAPHSGDVRLWGLGTARSRVFDLFTDASSVGCASDEGRRTARARYRPRRWPPSAKNSEPVEKLHRRRRRQDQARDLVGSARRGIAELTAPRRPRRPARPKSGCGRVRVNGVDADLVTGHSSAAVLVSPRMPHLLARRPEPESGCSR